jgi:hypothetical protein
VIALPGDHVDTVWNAVWQQEGSGDVVLAPASYDEVLGPGASTSVNFVAQGGTTQPASCTLNGSACS